MIDRRAEFLLGIGFTWDEIRELYEEKEYDNVHFDGSVSLGPDCLYAIVLEEELMLDLRETGEIVEAYWEKGWHSGYYEFRRSNFDVYQGRYRKAFPTRYKLWEFAFTKSLRRVLNKNSDLQTVIRPLRITPEKSDLYDSYNYLRFGTTPKQSLLKTYEYISNDDSKKMEVCVFKGNKLVACSFFEVGNFSMVGNSCFWDLSEVERSLGTLTLLLEVKYGLQRKMAYYYLGHFYVQNPAYYYKTRFGGLELYDWDNQRWIPFKSPQVKEMLKQRLPRHKD